LQKINKTEQLAKEQKNESQETRTRASVAAGFLTFHISNKQKKT